MLELHHGNGGLYILQRGEVQDGDAHQKAAHHAHEISKNCQQRHHDDQGQHARQHQKVRRGNAHGFQGVHFLVYLHGAYEGCIGGPYAAGHDYAHHDSAHDAQHAYAHQAGHIDLGTKIAQLHSAHKGQDEAEKKVGNGNNAKGTQAALKEGIDKVLPAHGGLAAHKAADRKGDVPEKDQKVVHLLGDGYGRAAKPGQEAFLLFGLFRSLAALDRKGQAQQLSERLRQIFFYLNFAAPCRFFNIGHKAQQKPVP